MPTPNQIADHFDAAYAELEGIARDYRKHVRETSMEAMTLLCLIGPMAEGLREDAALDDEVSLRRLQEEAEVVVNFTGSHFDMLAKPIIELGELLSAAARIHGGAELARA